MPQPAEQMPKALHDRFFEGARQGGELFRLQPFG
jgi:hypothetical protein